MYVKRHAVVAGREALRVPAAGAGLSRRARAGASSGCGNLGREDELKASGQLEALAGSFARLDPPLAGVRREVGPLLLVAHFLAELDLVGDRRSGAAAARRGRSCRSARSCAALIASRLCSPSPLYDVAGWASGAAVQELLGIPPALLNDDRLGRALETFAVYAETVRGALAARAIERFGVDAGRLHVDLTTLRVAGAYEDSALVAKGWGPDRRVARQVRALQATSADGVSVYVRPDPGNAAELALVGASLERLRRARRAGRACSSATPPAGTPRRSRRSPRRACGSSCRCGPARGSASATSHEVGHARAAAAALRRRAPARAAAGAAHPLPRRAARLADHRPRDRRSRSRCASPTSTPPRRRARSPPPASAR